MFEGVPAAELCGALRHPREAGQQPPRAEVESDREAAGPVLDVDGAPDARRILHRRVDRAEERARHGHVGIDEHEHVSRRPSGPGVARACYALHRLALDRRAPAPGDRSGLVGAVVVDDDGLDLDSRGRM